MASDDDNVFTIQLEGTRVGAQKHFFEVETSDSLRGVFEQYSKFEGVPLDSFQFAFKGKDVKPDETPASLGMNGDDNAILVTRILTGQALMKENIANACTIGSISTAIDLLSENKELLSEPLSWFDSEGQELNTPPIFIAIDYGHVELVSKMLPMHKDMLNTLKTDDGDYSPLSWASWTGHLEIVKLLIEQGGANVEEEALSLAREYEHNDVAEFLLQHIDLYSCLEGDADAIMEKACREGDANMVRKLLDEEQYNIEKWKDDEGKWLAFSPIYLAVKNAHLDVVQLFAERGLQVENLLAE